MVDDGLRTKDYREPERAPLGPAYLTIIRGGPSLGRYRVQAAAVIGRDASADLRVVVEGVSRKHTRIRRDPDGTLQLTDLGSRNGTFLNGRRVDTAVLRNGDEIRVGPVVLRLTVEGDTPSTKSEHARPASEGAEALPLRPRERQVAQLVAEGLTNAEVAARLGISAATVSRHLANVYQRLGIHSRVALTKAVLSASGSDPSA